MNLNAFFKYRLKCVNASMHMWMHVELEWARMNDHVTRQLMDKLMAQGIAHVM